MCMLSLTSKILKTDTNKEIRPNLLIMENRDISHLFHDIETLNHGEISVIDSNIVGTQHESMGYTNFDAISSNWTNVLYFGADDIE